MVIVGFAFDVTVTTLSCMPILPSLLKTTLITPSLPGKIGSPGTCGMVQPQVAVAFETISGLLPVFLSLKSCLTFSPWVILPKSKISRSKTITGASAGATLAVFDVSLTTETAFAV